MNPKATALEEKAWLLLKNGKKDEAVHAFHAAARIADTENQKATLRRRAELIMQGVFKFNKETERWEF